MLSFWNPVVKVVKDIDGKLYCKFHKNYCYLTIMCKKYTTMLRNSSNRFSKVIIPILILATYIKKINHKAIHGTSTTPIEVISMITLKKPMHELPIHKRKSKVAETNRISKLDYNVAVAL